MRSTVRRALGGRGDRSNEGEPPRDGGDHRRLQAFFDHALDGILIANDDGFFVDANLAACEILGHARDEILDRPLWDFTAVTDDAATRAMWRDFLGRGEMRGTLQLRRSDGQTRDISVSARASVLPGLHMSIIRDITDQRRLEQQLRAAQRMEAIGRLAGGIAHDFNNLLTVILGFTSEVIETYPDDPELQFLVGEVRRAGEQAAVMTRQLLAFSRRQSLRTRRFDLNETVRSMNVMLRRLIGEDLQIEVQTAPGALFVESDSGQIEQVITNLVVNARDAMPRGGRLTIETRRRMNPAPDDSEIPPGEYAELAVSDTGVGIEPEHLANIFEPFFTTKVNGKGTGLGLATVYGIAKQAGGHIAVESAVAKGSTFRVLLPLKTAATDTTDNQRLQVDRDTEGRSVLLVEDEPQVRHVAERLLERAGFRTLSAASAEEALSLLRTESARIDVVLSDVVMPRMSGVELAVEARAIVPGMPFVFMSGYSSDHAAMVGGWEHKEPLLAKPLQVTSLASALTQAIADQSHR